MLPRKAEPPRRMGQGWARGRFFCFEESVTAPNPHAAPVVSRGAHREMMVGEGEGEVHRVEPRVV